MANNDKKNKAGELSAKEKLGYADGGQVFTPKNLTNQPVTMQNPSDLPPGFQLDPSPPPANVAIPSQPGDLPQGFELIEDKYGSAGQMAIAAVEGVGRGALGPLAPMAEVALGVNPDDIRGRAEANPITHGIGEATGLVGSLAIPGVGQANVLMKAGKGAQALAGLSQVAKGAPVMHKVGSLAVAQAAEMAVYSSGDEIAKFILKDPDQTAETAISNIGLSTALGGGIGAGFATISPLWKATVGPKFEKALTGFREHLDGGGKLRLPEEIEAAQKALGIEISPASRAGMSGDPKAAQTFNELREAQNKTILADIKAIEEHSGQAVAKSLGVGPEDVLSYNEADVGHSLRDAFLKEYKAKYGPVSEQLAKRDEIADLIAVPDAERLDLYGKLIERGMEKVGTDSPFYKLYHDYGNRILAKDTIGGLDKLTTEINQSARTLGMNTNEKIALQDISQALKEFKEKQILKSAQLADEGMQAGANIAGMPKTGIVVDKRFQPLAQEIIAERTGANEAYRRFAEMSDKLQNHLGMGDFRGYKGLTEKLKEAGPEKLLRSFGLKGDADLIPFLKANFPETFEIVRQNELKRLIKPAVLSAKGESGINAQKLAQIVEKGMAGEKAYIETILSPEALEKINAASMLTKALPSFKSSGTAGWMTKMYKNMPASAMAAIGWLVGGASGGLSGALAGHMAQYLGREAPDAMKLAFLKFVGSEQPVSAGGLKAMVDMVSATYKGAKQLNTATNNLFKPTVRALHESAMPTQRQLDKIDRMVAEHEKSPNTMFAQQTQDSDVGYYLPAHQVALSRTSANAISYLSSLKPKPFKSGPLNKPIEPSEQEKARYNRALQIAQQPNLVLQRIKDGTILPSDIIDIKAMYPALYNNMVQQVSDKMINKQADEEPIPYKTRLGLSLFLGQPVDSSMSPESILKAQPIPNPKETELQQQAQGAGVKRSTSSLGKNTIKNSMTATQGAEASRQTRD